MVASTCFLLVGFGSIGSNVLTYRRKNHTWFLPLYTHSSDDVCDSLVWGWLLPGKQALSSVADTSQVSWSPIHFWHSLPGDRSRAHKLISPRLPCLSLSRGPSQALSCFTHASNQLTRTQGPQDSFLSCDSFAPVDHGTQGNTFTAYSNESYAGYRGRDTQVEV